MQDSFIDKLIKSPVTLIAGMVLLGAVLYNIWIVTDRFLTLHFEAVNLGAKIAEMQKKNESLKKEIEAARSAGFFEREGKSRMNLKRPGEEVVIVVPEKTPETDNENRSDEGFWRKVLASLASFIGLK